MKILERSFVSRARLTFNGALFAFLFAGFAIQSGAQVYTLTNHDSVAKFDVASGPGSMFNWTVDGVNQLNQSWFYYRVGSSGPEYPIENINGTPTINSYVNIPTLSRLHITYANSSLSVETLYILNGNSAGSGKANLSETVTVINGGASSLDFHFFEYSDFNLENTAGGQSIQFVTNSVNGQYYKAIQTSGDGASVTETITSASPPIGGYEAALYNQTLSSLLDGNPTTLDGVTNAGPGDVTFAYEWDVNLAPGASFQISKLLALAVPEPSSMALISSGLLVLAMLHRRRRGV